MTAEKDGKTAKDIFQRIAANDTYRKIAIAVGAVGILLIVLSGNPFGIGTQETSASSQTETDEKTVTAAEYEEEMEQGLTQILSQISGAGSVRVLVTLEQTAKKVYATEEKTSGQQSTDQTESGTEEKEVSKSGETTYILIRDSDGSEKALPVTEIQPVIKGVVVVCAGGDNPQVKKNIVDAVTTALQITSVRVCVVKSK